MATSALPVSVHPSQDIPTLSPLLSLPKELRLEIWRNTMTSPSSSPILHITQGHTSPPHAPGPPQRPYKRFHSIVKTSFDQPLTSPINPSLLRTNTLIYHDALPLLYATTTFQPAAMFDAFLSSLSSHATQYIKTVRLPMDDFIPCERGLSWAVLCAQVATLPSLGVVEVVWRCGVDVDGAEGQRLRRLVRPLLKIKARKVVVPDEAEGVQEVLAEVEREVAAEKQVRGERVRTEHVARRDGEVDAMNGDAAVRAGDGLGYCPSFPSEGLERTVANKSSAGEETGGGDTENEEWDMLSISSFESASKGAFPRLIIGTTSGGSYSDDETALLLDSDDWEVVDSCRWDDHTNGQ